MTNLVIHCGARHVERAVVEASPTPAASATWQPIPHRRLLELVETTLTAGGLSIKNQAHALWQEGDRYFGLLEVANGVAHADYAMVVALRNSHDKSFPAAIAMGSQVFFAVIIWCAVWRKKWMQEQSCSSNCYELPQQSNLGPATGCDLERGGGQ